MNMHLPGWLAPIIALTGVGAFIDFLIGRAGQDRARDWLTKWWVQFDDIRWNNFGKQEALFVLALMGRIFGKNIYDVKRLLLAVVLIISVVTIFGMIFVYHFYMPNITPSILPFQHLRQIRLSWYWRLFSASFEIRVGGV